MKSIKVFATAAMLAVGMSASAQFSGGGSSSSSTVDTNGWSSLWVEWNPSSFKYDVKNADNQSFTGLSVGYSQAFNVLPSKPLFVEAGLGLQYSFYKEDLGDGYDYYYDDYDAEQKFSMFSFKIPVNLLYKFDIPNSTVSLMPHAGINLRYNLSAKMKYTYEDYYDDESAEVDLFDKKDMGSDKATWNRFQLGWQIGVKARFGQSFLVGVSYGSDFSEIAKKTKISTTTISLGYAF